MRKADRNDVMLVWLAAILLAVALSVMVNLATADRIEPTPTTRPCQLGPESGDQVIVTPCHTGSAP